MTYGDRVRNMTDEELAVLMAEIHRNACEQAERNLTELVRRLPDVKINVSFLRPAFHIEAAANLKMLQKEMEDGNA